MKLETLAVHAGYSPEPTTKAVAVPIYQTSSYSFDSTQHGADLFDLKVAGNIYTRIMNPTQDVLEKRVAAMEGGIGGLALASGQAAITYAIMTIAEAGDNIVSAATLYGGTYNLFAHTLPQYGIEVRFANHAEPSSFEKLINGKTKAIYCESVGNPLGNITDFEPLAEIAHRHGLPLIVDNTVPSPYLCRPFEHGADIVVHSLTKYIGGHGNSIGGMIVDSGRFPWAEHKVKFRRLNEPDVSYHGVVYTEALGPAAFIGRARVVPRKNRRGLVIEISEAVIEGQHDRALRDLTEIAGADELADRKKPEAFLTNEPKMAVEARRRDGERREPLRRIGVDAVIHEDRREACRQGLLPWPNEPAPHQSCASWLERKCQRRVRCGRLARYPAIAGVRQSIGVVSSSARNSASMTLVTGSASRPASPVSASTSRSSQTLR